MSKKCEKCPMTSDDFCKCEFCSYGEPSLEKKDKKEISQDNNAISNTFIKNGIRNKMTGLLKTIHLVSDYELKKIIFEAKREQNRRIRNLQMRAAKKRVNKNEKNENGN